MTQSFQTEPSNEEGELPIVSQVDSNQQELSRLDGEQEDGETAHLTSPAQAGGDELPGRLISQTTSVDIPFPEGATREIETKPYRWRWIGGVLVLLALVGGGWGYWRGLSLPMVMNLGSSQAAMIVAPEATQTPVVKPTVTQAMATATPTTSNTPTALAKTPTATATEPVSRADATATAEGLLLAMLKPEPTATLLAQLPVIDLPALRDLLAQEDVALPAVAAESGKPIIIQAMAAGPGSPVNLFPIEPLLRKRPRILPAIGFVPSASKSSSSQLEPPTPTPIPILLAPGRLWATFAPLPAAVNDHFWVDRPFASSIPNQIAAPSYQFGSTAGGRYRVHHGMDIGNPAGTPVLSAATGEVVHAGFDGEPKVLGPYPNFYGNAVVIRLDRRLLLGGGMSGGEGGGLDVYLLYGHLSQVLVSEGQRVTPNDVIGLVGMTGIAIGPHLHVEMRIGANTYEQSVNPYLWVRPLDGTGAVAVRLLDSQGRTWPNARLTLARFENNRAVWARVIETYPDNESVNANPTWGENGAMDTVPAGYYYIYGEINGERVGANVQVQVGQTSFVELRTAQ